MKLTQITSPYNGKKLSKSQLNLLTKLELLGVIVSENPGVATNPFSGVSRNLDPLAMAIYGFIIDAHNPDFGPLSYCGQKVNVSTWDAARYLFLHLWPNEYYDLID